MNNAKYNILFPVETINRELDFRLFLAVLFADKSRRIFIGQHDLLDSLVPKMEGGLYVGKNLFKNEFPTSLLGNYLRLKEHGFSVVHLDEEGAIYAGDEDEWRNMLDRRLDVTVLREDDFVCTWGDFQARHYRSKNPLKPSNIRVTGHPRFDLYKDQYRVYYQQEVAELKEKYGRFILLNTNLTLANNSLGLHDSFSARCYYDSSDSVKRLNAVRAWRHTTEILANFVTLVHRLCIEFPDLSIIVRPHPSEDQSFYRTVFNGVDNVHVVHSGSVGPWIMASEALIHDGCTTAIEAYFSDKPIINYKSVNDTRQDLKIPNQFGIRCLTEEEVIDEINRIKSGKYLLENHGLNQEAYDLLFNFKGYAFEPLIKVMEEAQATIKMMPKSPSDLTLLRMEYLRMLENKARSFVRPYFPEKMRNYKAARYQFYGFDRDIINLKLDTIQNMLGKTIKFRQFSDALLVVEVE